MSQYTNPQIDAAHGAYLAAKLFRNMLDETADERVLASALEAERTLWNIYAHMLPCPGYTTSKES